MTEQVWGCGLIHARVCLCDSHVRGTGQVHCGWGGGGGACVCVCTRPRQAVPRTLGPRCVCGEEYASRLVCVAVGGYQCARWEGTSDGVTEKEPACMCVPERETRRKRGRRRERQAGVAGEGERGKERGRERREERGLELEPQQQVGLGPPGLSRDSRVLIVCGDDGALGRCQLALRAAVGSLPYLLASSLQLACLAAAVPSSLPPSSSSPLPARLPPCPTSELRV